jgi:hypothetical protein
MKKTYLLAFCMLFFLRLASAQQSNVKLISCDFQQASISQIVNDLESKSDYHFYYDQTQFDSLKVTLQANAKPIETILDMAFKNTDFHYAITSLHQVFITKGRQIKTELAPGFTGNRTVSQQKQAAVVADYTDEREKKYPMRQQKIRFTKSVSIQIN